MTITLNYTKYNRTFNSVVEFLSNINESNHVYYMSDPDDADKEIIIESRSYKEDVENFRKYKNEYWVANDCGYLYNYDNIVNFHFNSISYTGNNDYADYTVVSYPRITMPPIDKYIFDNIDELMSYLKSIDDITYDTPAYIGKFNHFLSDQYKHINFSDVVIFLIKNN